jgi:hypothetical protein
MKQDHVLVKDVVDDCVADGDGGDARCWVGFVVVRLSFFLFFS